MAADKVVKNKELKDEIKNCRIPLHMLASNMCVSQRAMKQILEQDLTEKDIDHIMWCIYLTILEIKSNKEKLRSGNNSCSE